MAEKKTKTKKVVTSDKHAITRINTIGNVFSYEHTTIKEKEKIKNADSTD
jgi:hypothetical protein